MQEYRRHCCCQPLKTRCICTSGTVSNPGTGFPHMVPVLGGADLVMTIIESPQSRSSKIPTLGSVILG